MPLMYESRVMGHPVHKIQPNRRGQCLGFSLQVRKLLRQIVYVGHDNGQIKFDDVIETKVKKNIIKQKYRIEYHH